MGFISDALGFGKEQKKQVQQTRSALEQAQDPEQQGAFSSSVSKVVESLLDTGIDGKGPFDPAARVADAALAKHGGCLLYTSPSPRD